MAEARVAELEHEVEGGGVEGARQRMVGAMEVATLKEQLAAANSRAVKAEEKSRDRMVTIAYKNENNCCPATQARTV